MKLSLLGDFRIHTDSGFTDIGHASARVIAFLALRDHAGLSRERLAGELWPDRSKERSLANLRSALWRLPPLVRQSIADTGDGLMLSADTEVDIELLDPTRASLPPAAAISGSLLPGWYDEWLIVDRERIELRRIGVLEQIATACLAQARYVEAIDIALSAIASEPFRESLHRIILQAHIDEGNFSEAAAHFARLQSTLADELGVAPSLPTLELMDRGHVTGARRQDATLVLGER